MNRREGGTTANAGDSRPGGTDNQFAKDGSVPVEVSRKRLVAARDFGDLSEWHN